MNLHFLFASSFQSLTVISNVKELRSLVMCTREVSKRELFWRPTTILKVEENQSQVKNDFINDLTEILAMDKLPYALVSLVNQTVVDVSEGNYLLVDYLEDSDALLNFNYDIKKKIKYLFILEKYSEIFWSNDFQSIANKVGNKDATFLVKISEAEYIMLTFIPRIDEETCKETTRKAFEINACKHGHLMTNETFPKKHQRDFKRCPIKAGLGALYPFSTIKNKGSLKTFDSLDGVAIQGMDVEMLKIIADYFNAKLELHFILKYEENPYIYTEYLPFIMNGSLDILAGGMYRVYGDVVEYSGIYARQAVVWVYTVDRLATTWQNLIANIDGLYLFIVFYFSYSFAWYIICVFDEHAVSLRYTLLSSWGALIGTASLQEARSIKQRVLNLVYLNMCLHLSVYISIQFYSFLTIRGPPENFETNEDIMNSGRTPYLRPLAKYFMTDEKYVRFANTSANCDSFIDCTTKVLEYKGLTVTLEGYFLDIQAATVVNDEARLLRTKDNLLTVFYEMSIYKSSPLAVTIQRVIGRLFETGITVKHFNDAIGITKIHKIRRATRNIISNSYSCQEGCTVTFGQISGVFYLWALGCGLASAVFVFELLYERVNRNKTIFERSNRFGLKVDKIL